METTRPNTAINRVKRIPGLQMTPMMANTPAKITIAVIIPPGPLASADAPLISATASSLPLLSLVA